jgi:hypothetical protein
MSDPIQQSRELQVETRRLALDFLRTELRVANTLLELAERGREDQSAVRRRAEARAAYGEVAKRLLDPSEIELSASEREELATGLARLGRRLGIER